MMRWVHGASHHKMMATSLQDSTISFEESGTARSGPLWSGWILLAEPHGAVRCMRDLSPVLYLVPRSRGVVFLSVAPYLEIEKWPTSHARAIAVVGITFL